MKERETLFQEYLMETPVANALWRSFEYSRFSREKIRHPILDLGCGDGFFASKVLRTMDAGLDIDERELRTAKKRDCYRHLVRSDARHLPFKDKSFRTVFSNCVLEHIPDIDLALSEIRRVLKPGGRLLMTVPSEYYGRYYGAENRPVSGGKALAYFLNRVFRHHCVETRQSWERRLRKAGLALLKSEYLIPRNAFNAYLAWLIPAFPSKISKLLWGRWVLLPRQWLARILANRLRRVFNEKDGKGVCYYFIVRRNR